MPQGSGSLKITGRKFGNFSGKIGDYGLQKRIKSV
jgi:hypothetical protein